jgi:hypothetical protein
LETSGKSSRPGIARYQKNAKLNNLTLHKLALFTITFLHGLNVQCQVSEIIDFSKIQNQDNFLPYKDKKGNYLGCGYTYECRGMSIVFYEVTLNKHLKILSIKGSVFDPRSDADTLRVPVVNIFLAKPSKNRLSRIRPLSATYNEEAQRSSSTFPHRNGDFELEVKFDENDRLYFTHPLFWPIEYNLGKLL